MPLKNRATRNNQKLGEREDAAALRPFMESEIIRTDLLPNISAHRPQKSPPISIPANNTPDSVDSSCLDNLGLMVFISGEKIG